jgi:hypothetical protein
MNLYPWTLWIKLIVLFYFAFDNLFYRWFAPPPFRKSHPNWNTIFIDLLWFSRHKIRQNRDLRQGNGNSTKSPPKSPPPPCENQNRLDLKCIFSITPICLYVCSIKQKYWKIYSTPYTWGKSAYTTLTWSPKAQRWVHL